MSSKAVKDDSASPKQVEAWQEWFCQACGGPRFTGLQHVCEPPPFRDNPMLQRSVFVRDLDALLAWLGRTPVGLTVRISVTERWARQVLRIPENEPLVYRGLSLVCEPRENHEDDE